MYPDYNNPDNPINGIYVDYFWVGGSTGYVNTNNKGRSATHEVGHWLNLLHT